MLKIQFKDRRKSAMWLVDSSISLGSDPKCDIVVEDATVDALHCELVVEQSDITLINKSANRSVLVNDVPVAKTQKLKAWDVIRLGDSELEIIDPLKERSKPPTNPNAGKTVIRSALSSWMLKGNSKPLIGQFYQITNGFTIGRDENADVTVPFTFISRTHVKLTIKGDKLFVEDANSSNGTFVNSERIKYCELKNTDELRLDEFSFTIIGPDSVEENRPNTVVREKKEKSSKIKSKPKKVGTLARNKVFLHDIDSNSSGKVYEIVSVKNHLSKMLGHHLSTSEKSVSARHVHFNETEAGWEVENNGAADGLIVNGKMKIRAVLKDGDEIIVGGTHLKFQSEGAVPRSYFTPRSSKSNTTKILGIIIATIVAAAVAYTQGWVNL